MHSRVRPWRFHLSCLFYKRRTAAWGRVSPRPLRGHGRTRSPSRLNASRLRAPPRAACAHREIIDFNRATGIPDSGTNLRRCSADHATEFFDLRRRRIALANCLHPSFISAAPTLRFRPTQKFMLRAKHHVRKTGSNSHSFIQPLV
jgi:hypothetical protein